MGLYLDVTRTQDQTLFLIVELLLVFAWGTTLQKSDRIRGLILINAWPTDIPIFGFLFDASFCL
jgi:hypothetical protein